jgi:hypothetical protein
VSALCVRLGAIEADWLLDMQFSRVEWQSRPVSVHCLMFDNFVSALHCALHPKRAWKSTRLAIFDCHWSTHLSHLVNRGIDIAGEKMPQDEGAALAVHESIMVYSVSGRCLEWES